MGMPPDYPAQKWGHQNKHGASDERKRDQAPTQMQCGHSGSRCRCTCWRYGGRSLAYTCTR